MKKALRILFVLSALLSMSALIVSTTFAQTTGNAGAIWTTNVDCGDATQDVNQYDTSNVVHVNGSGFTAGTYEWNIVGQPGAASSDPNTTVASGTITVDESGAFCFHGYTILPDDNGVYNVTFGNKGDNYSVNHLPTPTPSNTPTTVPATSTVAPTATSPALETPFPQVTVPATNTLVPTEDPVLQPTVAPTNTLVPTNTQVATNTQVPSNTLVPTQNSDPSLNPAIVTTPVPQKAPVTGGAASPALLQGAALILALISIFSLVLLKKLVG